MHDMQPLQPSIFAVITGAVNSGKSYQLTSILTAEVNGDRFALPTLFIMAEASGEGTAGEVLTDPGAALVWQCSDCEQATEAMSACFPDAGPLTLGAAKAAWHTAMVKRAANTKTAPPPPLPKHANDTRPLRSLVVDTASSLYKGSLATTYRLLLAEAGGKPGVSAGGKKSGDARYNDPRELHKFAAKRCGDMLDRLNGISMHTRGLVVLVTCHTVTAMQVRSTGERIGVGETPDLGSPKDMEAGIDAPGFSLTWNALAAKANVVWHCFETIPDFTGGGHTIATINARAVAADADGSAYRGVITGKGRFKGIGMVSWVKRQGGEGPLGVFASVPLYWHPSADVDPAIQEVTPTPNIGKVLAWAIEQTRHGGAQ